MSCRQCQINKAVNPTLFCLQEYKNRKDINYIEQQVKCEKYAGK